MSENYQILVQVFRALAKDKQANLMWHVAKGTRICCGPDADLYTDGKGGA